MQVLRAMGCLALAGLLISCADHGAQLTEPTDLPLFATGGNSGPSANGQATLPLELLGGRQTVSFHARQAKDGSVSGSWELKSRAQDAESHGNIDCLVVNGNVAIVGGLVTQSRVGPDFPFPVEWVDEGSRFWFKVVDNGEGQNDPPDLFTDVVPEVFPVTVCGERPWIDVPFDPAPTPIEAGNIQVKP